VHGGTFTADEFITSLDGNIDPILAVVASDKAYVESLGLKYACYEFGDEFDGVNTPMATAVMADANLRTHRVRSLQRARQTLGTSEISVVFDTDFIDSFGAYGCREYEGGPLTQQGYGQQDYCAGVRIAEDLASTAGFSAVQGSANGTHVGYINYAVDNSVFSLTDDDGGRLAINSSTGEVTVANTSLLTGASYARSFTIRDTNSGYASGHYDTTFSYNVFASGTGPTTWAAATDYTLSTNALTTTHATTSDEIVKATNGHSGTGDWWFKIKSQGSGVYMLGLANASEILGAYLGWSNNSIAVFQASGNVVKNNVVLGNIGSSGWPDNTEFTIRTQEQQSLHRQGRNMGAWKPRNRSRWRQRRVAWAISILRLLPTMPAHSR
jgi:hypothetical protein